ncbi:UDP-glycosyltransferase 89B1 [Morella rubra]|uniref:UDP-glycosyltransferase 89B1 n=1 Tax=Morella rubra TaxID=262757 RepID=A0A6A1VIX5_9ROSI|nr:UDP-glycosyltransferase 89B1 [Morella rubra]
MSITTTTGVHILVYPYPTSGHIIPLLDLTQRLLSRDLTVTILVTLTTSLLLEPYLSTHPSSLKQLVLPAPSPDIFCPPQKRIVSNVRAIRDLHYPMLLQWFQSQSSPPMAIISDFFLGWTRHLASELGVPRIGFSPSGAFALSVGFSMCRDPHEPDDPEDLNFQVSFPKIPNSPVYPWWQIPPHVRCFRGDPDKEFYMSNILDNAASWGLLFNSFVELERVYFDH